MTDIRRLAYCDPPYPGMSGYYKDHPDLARSLHDYDGWVLHTASTTLGLVIQALRGEGWWLTTEDGAYRPGNYRVMAWVKPFAAFKRNVPVAYAWEPVLVKPCRKPVVSGRIVSRDWIAEPMTMQRGLVGAKPEAVCRWLFEVVGAEPEDELVDMFPGSGAVTRAWERWRSESRLEGLA